MSNEKTQEKLEIMRHSASHVMAAAVKELFEDVKFAIGPAIEDGFYYDFDLGERTFSEEDLKAIEKKMKHIIKQNLKFTKEEVPIEEALKKMENQPYKQELIKELEKEGNKTVIFYKLGDIFEDLCSGPHVESSIKIGPFKLLNIAGAYWRGNADNKMLQRIYGTAFETKEGLDEYLRLKAEAEKRDHRKIGKELELFVFSDLVGAGLPLYTYKGALIRSTIQNFSNELRQKIGYQAVHTPQINKAELFKISGHYDKYKEDMFRVVSNYSDEEYYLKPMNCPQHTQIYASQLHSYKDLPIRIADFANLYRDEKPGELSGLTRLRAFSQDDGHCFCREDQIEEEFGKILEVIEIAMKVYGLEYHVRLSLRDENEKEKYLGDDETWQKSQALMEKLLKDRKLNYVIGEGEAAFYGPKMDLMVKDCLGRQWQLSTIQLDLNMPVRFKLEYVDEKGAKKTPVMIHSAIVGSPERFMALLIEHYAGAFPVWLAPVQVKVLNIGSAHEKYCQEVADKLKEECVRVELDLANETVGNKIRKAEKEKIPYILVAGDKEVESKQVAVRQRGQGDLGPQKLDEFIKQIKEEIVNRK